MIWKDNDGCHCNVCLSWATPTFRSNDIYLLQMHGEPCPLFLECIYMQHLPFTACTEPHQLICCCRSSTPVVYQRIFTCSRLIGCTKPLPPIQATFLCLQAYGSHTYRSIDISICLSWVYIARYLQSIVSTIPECALQFTKPGHIQVWPRSDCLDCYLGQHLRPGFNADCDYCETGTDYRTCKGYSVPILLWNHLQTG